MSDEPAGFLTRWLRRKEAARMREAAGPEDAPSGPDPSAAAGAPPAPAPQGESEEEASRRLGLPGIESLGAQSDYSVFMRDGVPEGLQRKALRKLWQSDPVLANLDGLDVYHEDYTDAATVVPDLKTLYRVGLGYLTDEEVAPPAAPETAGSAAAAEAATKDPEACAAEPQKRSAEEAEKA